jgi:hypothetical protein
MGFQDNSGDIIFDVVLTDEGRKQLAEGSFSVSHFKCADDEINYGLFDTNTGSAYQDLQILQTPIFESFTNNTSNMSSLLVTYDSQDLLYLPVAKLNQLYTGGSTDGTSTGRTAMHASGTFMVAVNDWTAGTGLYNTDNLSVGYDSNGIVVPGFIFDGTSNSSLGSTIYIEAGYDNDAVSLHAAPSGAGEMDDYIIEMDDRLGSIAWGGTKLGITVRDDDMIATYLIDPAGEPGYLPTNFDPTSTGGQHVIAGYRFNSLRFQVVPSQHLKNSDFYFKKFGGTTSMMRRVGTTGTNNIYYIDTLIKVTSIETGYTLEIPIRYVKHIGS